MTDIAEKLLKELPLSPTNIKSESELKKIHSYLPVPTDFEILWADMQSYGGYPSGVVITDHGLILKSGKKSVDEENAKRKQANKELKKQGIKDKDRMQEMLSVIYRIIPWEYYESDLLTMKKETDKKNNTVYIILQDGQELARTQGNSFRTFYTAYMTEERRIEQAQRDIRDSAVFSGLGTIDLDNTAFHAAYGADQSKTGHGIYAEHAGVILDRLSGEEAVALGQDQDETGHYPKNGPDKNVNGILIQCKYCNSANSSIRSCFQKDVNGNKTYRYFNPDGSPMVVEVPKDQYEKAVQAMEDHIKKGQVPGVTDPKEARSLVRRGKLTYAQARNLARAGTFESLAYDAVTGVVSCAAMCGISALVSFGMVYWQTKDLNRAAQAALLTGVEVFGPSFAARVLASQIARTGLSKALYPSMRSLAAWMDHNMDKLATRIMNAIRVLMGKGPLTGGAPAWNTFAKTLSSTAVAQTAMFAVFSIPHTYRVVAKKESGAQYLKDMTSLATSFVGYAVGSIGTGAAVGKVGEKIGKNVNKKVGGVAGFVGGTVGGTLVSSATRAAGNLLHEDDVLIAARLINTAITNLCLDYMLSEKEVQMLIDTLGSKENLKSLKKLQQNVIMSETQYKDIVNVLTPIFDEVVKARPVINKEMEQEMMDSMSEDICDKVEDAVGEDGSEEENNE